MSIRQINIEKESVAKITPAGIVGLALTRCILDYDFNFHNIIDDDNNLIQPIDNMHAFCFLHEMKYGKCVKTKYMFHGESIFDTMEGKQFLHNVRHAVYLILETSDGNSVLNSIVKEFNIQNVSDDMDIMCPQLNRALMYLGY